MSYDYYEEQSVPETKVLLINGSTKAAIQMGFDIEAIDAAISKYISDTFEEKLTSMIKRKLEKEMYSYMLSCESIQLSMDRLITKRIEEKYPEIVIDKVNEFAECLKKYSVKDRNNSWKESTIAQAADKKINDYIENELKQSVAKSTEYIEQFSKNYFAQNLFRAMGMMDKLLPQTESIKQ